MKKALKKFLRGVSVIGIDEEICKVFGKERGKLRRQGRIISDFDLFIASTCLSTTTLPFLPTIEGIMKQ